MALPLLYIGKPGDMRPLPIPDTGWTVGDKRYAALTRSLNGTGTETLFGTKKTFQFDLPGCTAADRAWLDVCWSGAVRPLYLIDPLQPNRFPIDVASTGSTTRGYKSFGNVGGAINVVTESDIAPFSVKLSSGTSVSYSGLIAVPGESVTVTVRLHATASVTPKLTALDASGAVLSSANGSAVSAGSSFVTSTTALTAPSGTATLKFELTTASAADITTNGWLATVNGATTWTSGGGAPKVTMTDLTASSPVYPYETVSVSLEEL